jgi:uncharacterized protein YbaR (Trm112 family)
MISQELLEMLRCPMDHGQSRLEAAADGLVCQRCRLKFRVKDGIPCMLVEEAELPPGCDGLSALPCQQPGAAGGDRS